MVMSGNLLAGVFLNISIKSLSGESHDYIGEDLKKVKLLT